MKIKSGFTLAELLMTMLIVGIVSVFGLKTIIHNDNVVRYVYSNVYHSLDKALYNAYYLTGLPNPFLTKDSVNGTEVTLNDNERVKRLCEMLTEYINFSERQCDLPPISVIDADSLKHPHFTSMNNVRFYISRRFPASANSDHFFFLVFADLNGSKDPNSMNYVAPSTDPDIFACAALDIARVCPLGPPEVDPRFMQTRVRYYDPNDSIIKFSTASKPYYISKAEAWGYYLSSGKLDDNFYIETNPLTYNGLIKEILRTADAGFYSNIYGFLNNSTISAPAGVTLKSNPINNNGYGCQKGFDTECEVIIDKFVY